jgi:hypothetical protein
MTGVTTAAGACETAATGTCVIVVAAAVAVGVVDAVSAALWQWLLCLLHI